MINRRVWLLKAMDLCTILVALFSTTIDFFLAEYAKGGWHEFSPHASLSQNANCRGCAGSVLTSFCALHSLIMLPRPAPSHPYSLLTCFIFSHSLFLLFPSRLRTVFFFFFDSSVFLGLSFPPPFFFLFFFTLGPHGTIVVVCLPFCFRSIFFLSGKKTVVAHSFLGAFW